MGETGRRKHCARDSAIGEQVRIDLLDNGYLEFIESYGSDERVVEAARMSTGKGFQGWGPVHDKACNSVTMSCDCDGDDCVKCSHYPALPNYAELVACNCTPTSGDEKLLAYLWNNKHATPFEMAGMVIEVQAPIFVFREWHRHRTQSYNELSARYTPLPDMNYVPSIERLMVGAGGSNKQAGTVVGAETLTEDWASVFRRKLQHRYDACEGLYQDALAAGVPKELARLIVPVGRYSRMRASANLRNWLAFLTLRMAPNAQWEIRQYANAVGEMIAQKFPRTWQLFIGETVK